MRDIEEDETVTQFVKLLTLHERRVRMFLFSLLVDRDAVDEVMQEVSTVLWKKFAQLEDHEAFLKWAYVIARYEVLAYRRRSARDRLVFDEGLLTQLAQEFESSEVDDVDQRQQCLDTCLQRLDDRERHLLAARYGQGMRIEELADRMNRSTNSVYKSLGRLRRRLKTCIESNLKTHPSV